MMTERRAKPEGQSAPRAATERPRLDVSRPGVGFLDARRWAAPLPVVGMKGEPLDPGQGSLHRGTMELQSLGQFRESSFRYVAAPLRNHPDQVGLSCQATVGFERIDGLELAGGGGDGTLEVGRFGVDDAIEVAPDRARDLPR